jgi:peptidoglycan endopeptidase LytF
MSRRDTIIIAVLLNAGLLIVLFATSLKTDVVDTTPQTLAVAAPTEITKVEPAPTVAAAVPPAGDEVDQALKQYVPVAVTPEAKPNFAADLQAIGSLEPQTPSTTQPLASHSLPGTSPTPTPEPLQAYKEVKVKKGDVLERIARQNHISVEELMKTNNLSSTRLKIGQVLKIPTKQRTSAAPIAEGEEGKYYTVKNGDNPWTIAVKNHMKVEELLKLNNLDEQQARRLKPGDKLRIK